jgi:uncharacterized protein (TIGR00255 family)
MTGYGRGEGSSGDRSVTVEVRSVNNRYLDCSVKLPRAYLFAEDAIKARVQGSISRGKVDVFVTIDRSGAEKVSITVNKPTADGYDAALCALRDAYNLSDSPTVAVLARFPDLLTVEKTPEDLETVAADICAVLDLALADFTAMREREGARLAEDVISRAGTIQTLLESVEERSPKSVAEYRQKLEARMAEVLQNTQIDESRILTEAAIFADKVAVAEETVRLHSHLNQLSGMLKSDGPVGRKLDFLIQEFNREANTIGSKCSDIELTHLVLDLKAEIEKIREQVQNIE